MYISDVSINKINPLKLFINRNKMQLAIKQPEEENNWTYFLLIECKTVDCTERGSSCITQIGGDIF